MDDFSQYGPLGPHLKRLVENGNEQLREELTAEKKLSMSRLEDNRKLTKLLKESDRENNMLRIEVDQAYSIIRQLNQTTARSSSNVSVLNETSKWLASVESKGGRGGRDEQGSPWEPNAPSSNLSTCTTSTAAAPYPQLDATVAAFDANETLVPNVTHSSWTDSIMELDSSVGYSSDEESFLQNVTAVNEPARVQQFTKNYRTFIPSINSTMYDGAIVHSGNTTGIPSGDVSMVEQTRFAQNGEENGTTSTENTVPNNTVLEQLPLRLAVQSSESSEDVEKRKRSTDVEREWLAKQIESYEQLWKKGKPDQQKRCRKELAQKMNSKFAHINGVIRDEGDIKTIWRTMRDGLRNKRSKLTPHLQYYIRYRNGKKANGGFKKMIPITEEKEEDEKKE